MIALSMLSYHEYEGIALNLDERERLVADLGMNNLMILRQHGTLACGKTVASAFLNIHLPTRLSGPDQDTGRRYETASHAGRRAGTGEGAGARLEDRCQRAGLGRPAAHAGCEGPVL